MIRAGGECFTCLAGGGLGDARAELITAIQNVPGVGNFATKLVSNLETVVEDAAIKKTTPIVIGGLVGMMIVAAAAVAVLGK